MRCREVDTFAELSLDGELDAKDQAVLDLHLADCPECRRRTRALAYHHRKLQDHLQSCSGETPPIGLATRVRSEIRRADHRNRRPWVVALPWSFAALVLIASVVSATGQAELVDPARTVERHAARLPPEVRAWGEPSQVHRFLTENFGEVRLPKPQRMLPHLQLVGARLDHVADRKAALLMFDRRGARVSMLVYGWESESIRPPPRFELRRVEGKAVVVGQHRGYNVVAFRRGPHLYSVVSDLDQEQLLQMARAF